MQEMAQVVDSSKFVEYAVDGTSKEDVLKWELVSVTWRKA